MSEDSADKAMRVISEDLNHILENTQALWNELYKKSIFLTGGSGFFGSWILESFLFANRKLNLKAKALVLTRNPATLSEKMPHIMDDPSVEIHVGDVRDFDFPEGEFSHIIHLASASAIGKFLNEDPLLRFDTIVQGTRRVLDFAQKCRARKFLCTSTGYVYGKQVPGLTLIPEDYKGLPELDDPNAVLGFGKRTAELLCVSYSKKFGFDSKIARCFSFVGPYLQLNIHYAIGNFIRDTINGGPIVVKGDGTAVRSYMYVSDLMIWLWTILFKGKNREPYNVGSEKEITIKELAFKVAEIYKKLTGKTVEVIIREEPDPSKPADRYVPSTRKAKTELGLKQTVSLEDAIEKTLKFYLYRGG